MNKAEKDLAGFAITGYWAHGKIAFKCSSEHICEGKWSQAISNIQSAVRSKALSPIEQLAIEIKLEEAKCKKRSDFKFPDQKNISGCISDSKSAASHLFEILNDEGKRLHADLNEIKAGLVQPGTFIWTIGIGLSALQSAVLLSSPSDLSPVFLKLDQVPPSSRAQIFKECADLFNPCVLTPTEN